MASNSTRKRRIVLTLSDKTEILKRLKSGETAISLSKEYNVRKSTISSIKKNENEIVQYQVDATMNGKYKSEKKTMSAAENSVLESAIYLWFSQQRALGVPVSGPILRKKALELNGKLKSNDNFMASKGWLRNFKERHGIGSLNNQGEMPSKNREAIEKFTNTLRKIIQEDNYSEELIYNADESALYWNTLPRKLPATESGRSTSECKSDKERVTVMMCSNATGSHKLPLTVIGKSSNLSCCKNISNVPVNYRIQKNGWMDMKAFEEWYLLDFLPRVKEQQTTTGKTGKILLLIDNSPSHTLKNLTHNSNEICKIICFPPNVTSFLQPMEQGIVEKVKRLYKQALLKGMLCQETMDKDVRMFLKSFSLKDCCCMINEAWNRIDENDIRKSWKRIVGNEEPLDCTNEDAINDKAKEIEIAEIHELLTSIPHYKNCDITDTVTWLRNDEDDRGFEILNDDEIIESVTRSESTKEEINREDESEEETENSLNTFIPKHADAFSSLNTVIKWFSGQPESNTNDLRCLRKLKELALIKSLNEQN